MVPGMDYYPVRMTEEYLSYRMAEKMDPSSAIQKETILAMLKGAHFVCRMAEKMNLSSVIQKEAHLVVHMAQRRELHLADQLEMSLVMS